MSDSSCVESHHKLDFGTTVSERLSKSTVRVRKNSGELARIVLKMQRFLIGFFVSESVIQSDSGSRVQVLMRVHQGVTPGGMATVSETVGKPASVRTIRHYLPIFANFALGMNWLSWSLLPKRQCFQQSTSDVGRFGSSPHFCRIGGRRIAGRSRGRPD